jgi:DNA-binding transcriptional ArsR family regulator
MEDKITLDKAAFKALASETRVSLLKKLGSRRATPSELAQSLGVTPQAASEHLAQLEKAGLVKRDARPEDEGRKWVYYSLTEKGAALVRPSETKKIWVLLSTGALALAVGAWSLLTKASVGVGTAAPAAAGGREALALSPQPQAFGADAVKAVESAVQLTASPSPSTVPSPAVLQAGNCAACSFQWELFFLVLGSLLVAAAAYYYLKRYSRFKRRR